MLVLTRKLQQQIKIGDQITVTVLRVKGNTVRIGVAAPRDVRVVRGELPKDAPSDQPPASCDEQKTVLGAAGDEDAADAAELEAAQCSPAPRLPQLRVFDRYGGAPLKQLVSGSVLAK